MCFMALNSGMICMETPAFIGLLASIGGLVLFLTSGTFEILSPALSVLFQNLGIILIYIGVAFILWGILNSINTLFESIVKRDWSDLKETIITKHIFCFSLNTKMGARIEKEKMKVLPSGFSSPWRGNAVEVYPPRAFEPSADVQFVKRLSTLDFMKIE